MLLFTNISQDEDIFQDKNFLKIKSCTIKLRNEISQVKSILNEL